MDLKINTVDDDCSNYKKVETSYAEMAVRYFKSSAATALALKSSVATATHNSFSNVERYRYFTTKVAAQPATLNNM